MKEINRFSKENAFLSNFYERPIVYMGLEWPSSEHAYQAMKTKSPELREMIRVLGSPAIAKQYGRALLYRPDWDEVKVQFMREIVHAKFTQHVDLRAKLLETGNALLVEGNNWGDKTWGMVVENGKWVGENWLGRILMEVREELKQQ